MSAPSSGRPRPASSAVLPRLTLGRKFGLVAAATAILAVSLATGLAVHRAEDLARESLRRRAYTLAATIGSAYLGPILAGDRVEIGLDALLGVVLDRDSDVARVVVRTAEGDAIADVGRDRPGGTLTFEEPIILPGPTGALRLGSVQATFSTDSLDRLVRSLRWRFGGVGLGVAAAALVVTALLAGTVTRPIRALEAAAERLRAKDYAARAAVRSADEIGDLAATFNEMAAQIEADQAALERDKDEITAIQEFSRQLSAELAREKLHSKIVETFHEFARVSKVSLWIYEEKTDTIALVEGRGIDKRAFDLRFRRGEGIVGRIIENLQPVILEDIRRAPGFVGEKVAPDRPPESLLALPLRCKDRLVGVICLNNKVDGSSFTERDRTVLMILADSAAVSVENARLYEMAITDGLTNLFIHRYFQQRMDEEIARARRYGHRLSLLMLDIDRFKSLNDTYGHQTGDGVLVSVARVIRRSLREADIPCRYGGEEFALILPDTDAAGAKVVAERIRTDMEAFEFQGPQGRLHVTISIGASTHREGMVKDEMIFEADKALYAAKNAGRNRTFHYLDLPRGGATS